ncbi:hypothetical protein [Nostoc sp.]|uniref:hypothetical protein n=1 Tax=Nostoc sp. TaxID=1180 RepID=UPI002FF77149
MSPDNFFQEARTVETSNSAACYFPLMSGRYEIKPGMMPFGSCFGNTQADSRYFKLMIILPTTVRLNF